MRATGRPTFLSKSRGRRQSRRHQNCNRGSSVATTKHLECCCLVSMSKPEKSLFRLFLEQYYGKDGCGKARYLLVDWDRLLFGFAQIMHHTVTAITQPAPTVPRLYQKGQPSDRRSDTSCLVASLRGKSSGKEGRGIFLFDGSRPSTLHHHPSPASSEPVTLK